MSRPPLELDGVFTDQFAARKIPPRWIIKDLLPVGLTIIAGPPKSQKTTIVEAVTALVAGFICRALPPSLSHVVEHGQVLKFSREADAGELRDISESRMKISGEDNGRILVADDPWDFQLDEYDKNGRPAKLVKWLRQIEPLVCVVDPLRDFHSQDEDKSGDMIKLLRPLRQWAVNVGSSMLLVHHTSKLQEGQTHYDATKVRGSSAIFGALDGLIVLTPKDGKRIIQMKATFKRGAPWDRTIGLGVDGAVCSEDASGELGAHTNANVPDNTGAVDKLILTVMRGGTTGIASIQKQVGIATQDITAALQRLANDGHVIKEGNRWAVRA